jgi:hypothetical protein
MAPYTFMTFNNSLELALGVRRRIGYKDGEPQNWCDDAQTLIDPRYRYKRSLNKGSPHTSTEFAPDRKCAGNGCMRMVARENDHGSWGYSSFAPQDCAYCSPVNAGCFEHPSRSHKYKRMVMRRESAP